MNEHSGALVGAMVKERHDSWIVEIFLAHMIANLHAEMAGAACSE